MAKRNMGRGMYAGRRGKGIGDFFKKVYNHPFTQTVGKCVKQGLLGGKRRKGGKKKCGCKKRSM